eukprot:4769993-Amphidinium_carterae.1
MRGSSRAQENTAVYMFVPFPTRVEYQSRGMFVADPLLTRVHNAVQLWGRTLILAYLSIIDTVIRATEDMRALAKLLLSRFVRCALSSLED